MIAVCPLLLQDGMEYIKYTGACLPAVQDKLLVPIADTYNSAVQ